MKSLMFKDGHSATVGNIYCIGRSYAEHISELGNTPTGEPVVFMKPTTALTQNTTLTLPSFSDDVHHEVELVVYIGRDIRDDEEPSLDAITGYGVGLDLTARDVQANLKAKGLPWTLAKGFRDAAWLSPLMHGTPPVCQVFLSVNDEIRQDDSTDKMLFDVLYQLKYLHKHFGLRAGDLIYTGTPKGVGKLSSGDQLVAKLNGDEYNISVI
ncbi:fumarylacetoacetate hydrolase family protein [Moraxella porci]|uniref:fumarylacetoacetate hydrolase family protein n=1 Tax=Moraxella porci TaxID=1288392 RepID=UPI002447BAB2|nr:fumarylacetoacetate hydrolase family protein [Moraxella porci]MDH2272678.1 fumarylacetoacetate hydrolase family protein [Moraxella porci]